MTVGLSVAPTVDPDVADLAEAVVRFMRSSGRVRAKMLAAAERDLEWSAHIILKVLDAEGPMRAGSVAEAVSSDPSTVSRQVATLVRQNLLERRADPDDGRASLLVVTAAGRQVLAEHDRVRLEYFVDMVADWAAEDITTLTVLLRRFTDAYNQIDYDRVRQHIKDRTQPQKGLY